MVFFIGLFRTFAEPNDEKWNFEWILIDSNLSMNALYNQSDPSRLHFQFTISENIKFVVICVHIIYEMTEYYK